MNIEEIKIHKKNIKRMEKRLKSLEEEERLGVVHSLTESASIYGLRFMIQQSKLYLSNDEMRHAMNETQPKHDGAIWRCLYRLVRWFGPTWCFVGMMLFILTANSRAAGVDALLVAFFAMGYGFLSANVED